MHPGATAELWLYSAVANTTVVPKTARETRKLSPRLSPCRCTASQNIVICGDEEVSDGTRTRGRRDHNPHFVVRLRRIRLSQAI
jgi:hypothetical protein